MQHYGTAVSAAVRTTTHAHYNTNRPVRSVAALDHPATCLLRHPRIAAEHTVAVDVSGGDAALREKTIHPGEPRVVRAVRSTSSFVTFELKHLHHGRP